MATFDPIHPEDPTNPGLPNEEELTVNYQLILNTGRTITSWLTIFNVNMNKIDDALHNIALRTSIDGQVPPEAIEDIIKINGQLAQLQKQLSTVELDTTQLQEQVTSLQLLQPDVAILKQNYINLDTTVSALQTVITSIQQSLAKLETNVETLSTNVYQDLETLNTRVTTLEEKEETT